MKIAEKLFGTHSDRELKIVNPIVDKIEAMRDSMMALSDEELRDKTKEYKKRLEEGETLDDLLPEAFATVREAARRVLGMEHYRVQLMGGVVFISAIRPWCSTTPPISTTVYSLWVGWYCTRDVLRR